MALRGIPLLAAMLLAVLSTTLIGVAEWRDCCKGSIPPFIATYGMQNILNSLSLLLAAGSSILFSKFYIPYHYRDHDYGNTALWSGPLYWYLSWCRVVLNKTRFGTNIHGLGGNRGGTAACRHQSHYLPDYKTYAFAGFIAGIAGSSHLSRIEAGMPTAATGWEFAGSGSNASGRDLSA